MVRLLFVRHGRTSWNVEGRVQGGGDLDEVGVAQVTALSKRLQDEKIETVYASPFPRTVQTAEIVSNPHQLEVKTCSLLKDLNYGKYSGSLLSDVKESDPELWLKWKESPHLVTFDDGESLSQLRMRIKEFINQVSKNAHHGKILCVTHDSPIRIVVSLALGYEDSLHNDKSLLTPLASLTEINVDSGRFEIIYRQDSTHLNGVIENYS